MPDALVFSRTADYRHESIPAGVSALADLCDSRASEDPDALLDAGYRVVVFLNTSGDVLGDAHREALRAHLAGGGGFVGVHCAAVTEQSWPFYRGLVAARFAGHPEIQPATIEVVDTGHPAGAGIPAARWRRVDEWYNFDAPPSGVRVLLRLDESSYAGGTMGADHPLAWCHEYGGGRVVYTALGHTVEAYDEPEFRAHLLGAITWAAGG